MASRSLRTSDLAKTLGVHIERIADRWLASVLEQEERAQAIIRQIGRLVELTHT